MDISGPIISANYQGVLLIFQANAYGKAPFGTITKCVGYGGIFIFNNKFQ